MNSMEDTGAVADPAPDHTNHRDRRPLPVGTGRNPYRPGQNPPATARPRAAQGLILLRHRDEALEAYLYDYHGEQTSTQTRIDDVYVGEGGFGLG